ncbi:MAG TPA: hypothetical protein VM680_13690 [Verrucomicrobiae bacterium]|nr:hypothetical protein [Verrucomicrobiae bacterium]
MNFTERRSLWIFVFAIVAIACSRAAVHNISFKASVTAVNDRYFQLDASITNGAPVEGFYIYDDAASDSNGDATVGDYRFNSGANGITVKIGPYVFRTNPNHVNFLLEVVNRETDGFVLHSYYNICSLPLFVEHISLQLDDPTGTAFSNDLIPTAGPVLAAFTSQYGLTIAGGGSDDLGGGYFIRANPTSITETPINIPEPPAVEIEEALELKFQTVLGYFYQLQESRDHFETWTNVGEPILGDGTVLSKFVPKVIGRPSYYRTLISNQP